ncbi:hypothetical protein scyTo_0005749, partial [Scyliorhinus torazame]|nr:hypothetical protein [Scyliorhinus torazame]
MNIGWSSYNQPIMPSVAESCQISSDLNPKMMCLNSDPEYLGTGYQEVSSLQFQDVISASSNSPHPSHPAFKMGVSQESEHQFTQTGVAEMASSSLNLPMQAIGFEAMEAFDTDLTNQYSIDAPFPNPPNTCEPITWNPQSQLLLSTSSTNWCPQPDVWGEIPASDLPTSDHGVSFQPSNNNFPARYNPGESKEVSLPLMDQQVKLVDKLEGSNEEVAALCNLLNMLRAKYPSSETWSNCGLIRSIVTEIPDELLQVWRIPVTIVTDIFPEPVQTSPHASCTAEELIHTILSSTQQYVQGRNDYVLKLCDAEEILQNPYSLGSHECLQHYLKLGSDIRLQLFRYRDLQKALARTAGDDQSPSTLHHTVAIENGTHKTSLSRKDLGSKLKSYHDEAKSLLSSQKSTGRVVEEVKAICYMLSSVETKEITEAIQQLQSVVLQRKRASFHPVQLPDNQGSLSGAINALTGAVSQLVHIYCNNFDTDYQVDHVGAIETPSVEQTQLNTTDLSFIIYAVHGIPSNWAGSYENLFVSCSLIFGGNELCQGAKTDRICITKPSLFFVARWNQKIDMPIAIGQLPCEVTLSLTLHGYHTTAGTYSDANRHSRNAESLASASMPLYSSKLALVQSSKLLCLVPANTNQADSLILQIDFPTSLLVRYVRPVPADNHSCFTDIDEVSRKQITDIQQKHSLLLIGKEERNLLWTKRSFCNSSNCFLPLLLGSAPSWCSGSLPEIHAVLWRWNLSANPLESLGLLLSSFSDQEVRRVAVQQIGTILDDELLDYLPQLVQ